MKYFIVLCGNSLWNLFVSWVVKVLLGVMISVGCCSFLISYVVVVDLLVFVVFSSMMFFFFDLIWCVRLVMVVG